MKFLQVDTIEKAREKLLNAGQSLVATEKIALAEAYGRVLSQDVFADENLPLFRRSTVDGYAVVAKDTGAAGEALPTFLKIVGAVEMGQPAQMAIKSGECVEMPTGGMLPEGADAVAMVEFCEVFGADEVAIYKSVGTGGGVVQIGDDMKAGQLLVSKGKELTPQDIGALAVAGVEMVEVFAPLKVAFISTGDELITPHHAPLEIGKIRETNGITLSALAAKHGYHVAHTAVVQDDEDKIKEAVLQAMETCQIVAVSGGSSQGKKDMTADILDELSDGGVFTHGIAIKPGKPTILGFDKGTKTLMVGLPGHPISAMAVFELLFGWLIRKITHQPEPFAIPAALTANVPASEGKLTFYPCKLTLENNQYTATPIYSKSGLIAALTVADGYFLINRDNEGLKSGEAVMVHLF
ncbi:MAG: molybdopterin molybdotransferase MoeA [Defluviitaleaceae bacterium]|nr:molybdopterin molybdotransferase MoeA [Defluviitaleaceae bacterium]